MILLMDDYKRARKFPRHFEQELLVLDTLHRIGVEYCEWTLDLDVPLQKPESQLSIASQKGLL